MGMYVERSFTTAANELLAEYENRCEKKVTDEQIQKSTEELVKLGIYDRKWYKGKNNGTGIPGGATREHIITQLTIQLGNPKVREKDRSHLARLLDNDGRPCPDCKGYGEVCSRSQK